MRKLLEKAATKGTRENQKNKFSASLRIRSEEKNFLHSEIAKELFFLFGAVTLVLGATLWQIEYKTKKPIAYTSRGFSHAEEKYAVNKTININSCFFCKILQKLPNLLYFYVRFE